jgi:DNA repair protein RadC
MSDAITTLPPDDRPRERLLKRGATTLTDTELLAIVLGSGTCGKNAIELARELLVGGRLALARRDVKKLTRVRGMGSAKAARLMATFELARRFADREEEKPSPTFDADALGRSLMIRFAPYLQERVGGVFLDRRNRILENRVIFAGSIDRALVSPREIIRLAFDKNAVGVVLYHNHPSGDPSPSMEDLLFTEKLKGSLNLCDLTLVDHVIVSTSKYFSMRNHEVL